jgi:PAS domain S-box-containing protein
LFHSICQAARELLGAKYATVSVLREGQRTLRHFYTSGMDTQTATRLGSPMPQPHILTLLLAERRPFRSHNPSGDPKTAGFSPTHPPIHSLLVAPFVSTSHVYGWLCFIDKVGAEGFSEEDERLAGILGAQVGRMYENRRLYAELEDHTEKLEREVAERKQAEEQFRLVVETSPNAILLVSTTGQIHLANTRAEMLFGYPRKELIGQQIGLLLPQVSAQHHGEQETFFTPPGTGSIGGGQDLFGRRKDGSQVPIEIRRSPITTPEGTFVLASIIDITQRKQAEEEIRRRNRELSLLNQVIAASAAGQEPTAVLEIACRELALVFDIPFANVALLNEEKTAAVVGVDYAAEGPFRDRPTMLNITFPVATSPVLQYLLTHKTPLVIADALNDPHLARFRSLLEQRGVASLLLLPLIIEGEVVGGLGLETIEPRHFSPEEINLAWSVADQVAGALARTQMIRTQQRLSTAIEQAGESMIITNLDGTIIYVNPAFEHISGYSRAKVVGQNPRLLKSDQQDAAFYRELWAIISAGQVWHGRLVNKKKDGTLYTVDATITPVRDESGTIVNYVGVQRDVTRELQLEEQYRQAPKMQAIGRLSGGVAHDFNNLLVVITGYSELLLDRHLDAASPLRKYVEEIKKAGERAAGLTRQLLAFSRQQVLQPEILELNEVVANTEKMLRRLIGESFEPGIACRRRT